MNNEFLSSSGHPQHSSVFFRILPSSSEFFQGEKQKLLWWLCLNSLISSDQDAIPWGARLKLGKSGAAPVQLYHHVVRSTSEDENDVTL